MNRLAKHKFAGLAVVALGGMLLMPYQKAAALPLDWIGSISAAISLFNQFRNSQLTLQDATNQIIAQIEAAESNINSHMDALEVADDRACVDNAILALSNEAANWGQISQGTKESDAVAAQNCVSDIVNDAYGVDLPAVDQLGFALAAIEPLVGMLNANAGWTTTSAQFSLFRSGNSRISTVLMASSHCLRNILWGDCAAPCRNPEVIYTCTAYNGGQGGVDTFLNDPQIPQEVAQAQVDSLVETSYQLVQQGLETLR